MAIKTLGSAQKIRVSRESGNTIFIFLGLRVHYVPSSNLVKNLNTCI